MKNNGAVSAEVNVGARLRELRARSGLSIRSLAEKSGLNFNTLSLIENNKTSPSVSTLQQIAAALEIPIAAFFENQKPSQKIIHQQNGVRPTVAFAHGLLADLGAGFSDQNLEFFEVKLEPKAHSGSAAIVHTGVELVYCLEGWLEYEVEQHSYTLAAGDSLVFEAHLPHRWRNAGETPSRSLLLLCPADERDRPDQQHFSAPQA
jgi:quercetin dioxygenase-like cupin family protein/DNA-binding Xre family transcriptional regulator